MKLVRLARSSPLAGGRTGAGGSTYITTDVDAAALAAAPEGEAPAARVLRDATQAEVDAVRAYGELPEDAPA